MNCAEIEALLCDYVDGTLPTATAAAVEAHLPSCPACAGLARDAAAAVGFMERAAEVELPPELLTRILFQPPWAAGVKPYRRNWLRRLVQPMLAPRFAMGMAMTLLSFAMLARFVSPMRQLRREDLEPARVWAALDDRVYRGWQRTVKFYESIRLVYQIQTRLREWQQDQEEENRAMPQDRERTSGAPEDHKLPVRRPVENNGPPGPGSTR